MRLAVAYLAVVPAVVVIASLLLGALAAGGPCPSPGTGGC